MCQYQNMYIYKHKKKPKNSVQEKKTSRIDIEFCVSKIKKQHFKKKQLLKTKKVQNSEKTVKKHQNQ